jgi:hypothetical protein
MQEFYLIAVAVVTIVSAARITRLAVYDEFPPVEWLRARYTVRTEGTGWELLAKCGFCMSFWVTAAVIAWGLLAHVYGHPPNHSTATQVWWIANGIFAASYLSAMTIARDGDK